MTSNENPRPYRIWNAQRTVRKSLVAKSLAELKTKGARKLGYEAVSVTAVLEEDGTEVDDDDYLSFLSENPVILLLKDGEEWAHPSHSRGEDSRDGPLSQHLPIDQADGDCSSEEETDGTDQTKLQDILKVIRGDTAKIITLSSEEMLILADADSSVVARGLGMEEREATRIQFACQRHLDDRTKALDAISLLKTCTSYAGESNPKKPRTT